MYKTLVLPFLRDLKNLVLDAIFPIRCVLCENEGQFLCQPCLNRLTKLEQQYCIACHKPSLAGVTHPKCISPHLPEGLISYLNYRDERVADAIIKGKYKFLPKVYEILGQQLSEFLIRDYPDWLKNNHVQLVPLPLHKRRQRWRGFNQAEILCAVISVKLNLKVLDVLSRRKATKTQKDLKKEQRVKNLADAFELKPDADVHGKNLILVDDVTTTGSTLLQAAKVLKRNGANTVWCLTIARD